MQLLRNLASLTGTVGQASLAAHPKILDGVLPVLGYHDHKAATAAAETLIAMVRGASSSAAGEPSAPGPFLQLFRNAAAQELLFLNFKFMCASTVQGCISPATRGCWAAVLLLGVRMLRVLVQQPGVGWCEEALRDAVLTMAPILKSCPAVSDDEVSDCTAGCGG